MPLMLNKSLVDSLGYDLVAADAAFKAEVEAHAFTVDVPAPLADEIVERIVRLHGGEFEVVDDTEIDQSLSNSEPPSLLSHAAAKRWQRETGGIEIAGVPVATDDRSKVMILGARVAAASNPDWTTVWQGADGESYPLDAAAAIAISDAVQAHVAACFATFAEVKAGIDGGTITTTAEIDAAFAAI